MLSPTPAAHPNPPRSVRLSLTDRCDLACIYCRPHRRDGYLEERLEEGAWRSMIRGLVRAGVRRVRLTGGEPLLHPRAIEILSFLGEQGLDDIALTTNGTRLAALAGPLRRAGLRRLTISLDSLVPERFFQLTRGGNLARVLEGIDEALRVGFDELKINAVILRDRNDDELENLTRWSWERRITPRFIEVMRVGEGANLPGSSLFTAREMRERLAHLLVEGEARVDPDRGPARYLRACHDAALRVGFISGTSDTFCESCDRLRVASDGVLRPCLATNDGVDAATLARSGDEGGIEQAIGEAWSMKPNGRVWKGCTESSAAEVSMRAIGG
jgi:cyclic pyranopterin phosphate synthase